ncbi:DUF61 family protein [Methanofollis fontis]|uniref:DUF61 domain-containing protein n=1 Tax=Methanofollis fontis TaxID=2052832 RepID=A0A483CRW3_9EURY|nr:DUF61 family protein [Methanofollis fontis]TAJ45893.1 DUF61 domain-containing protein [Methanofollis fontis]
MSYRPEITEESVLRRWMILEIGRINAGLVTERKSLARLLGEERPSATAKDGSDYRFDPAVIRDIGERLPADLHERLLLPIIFRFSPDVRDSYYLTDAVAVRALQSLGELSEQRKMRDGRLWVSNAIVFAMVRAYPTAIQIGMG